MGRWSEAETSALSVRSYCCIFVCRAVSASLNRERVKHEILLVWEALLAGVFAEQHDATSNPTRQKPHDSNLSTAPRLH